MEIYIGDNLPIVYGAAFDSYMNQHEDECLPGTRTDILLQISEWALSSQGKCIFWLNGMAGTGKSTISRSVAKTFKEANVLGASFFFKRGEGDRANATKFFPTIAKQLARSIPQLVPGVHKAVFDNPDIAKRAIEEQFDKLLLQPLLNLKLSDLPLQKVVIVIDAFDECERDNDIRLILQLLPQLQKSKAVRLRIFVTSRPELPVRLGFAKAASLEHEDLILSEIPHDTIENDISLFLNHRLSKVRKDRSLPEEWPGETVIQALVAFSFPSFAPAATICHIFEHSLFIPADNPTAILTHLSEESKRQDMVIPNSSNLLHELNKIGSPANTDYEIEDDTKSSIGDRTDIESIFSVVSTSSWQSSQPEITSIAISELVGLLLNDDQLMVLYSTAISKVGPERFQRNFARMLKRYGWSLNEEASNKLQREAARFVRLSARQTAVKIRMELMEDSGKVSIDKQPESTRLKSTRVNEWIESHTGGQADWYADADESSADSDSADSEIYEPNSVATLEEVKDFMMSTKAFSDLRQDFRLWLDGKRRVDHEGPSKKEEETLGDHDDFYISDSNSAQGRRLDDAFESAILDGSSGDSSQQLEYTHTPSEEILATCTGTTRMTRLSSWWLRLMNIYAPPAAGYQRISYICGCGKLSYLDVRELSTGGIERFRRRLFNSVATARTYPQNSLGLSHLDYPPQAHLDPVSSTTLASENVVPFRVPYKSPSQSTQPEITQTRSMTLLNQESQFVLICINTKNSTALIHIEVGPLTNDQYLFQQIYQEYQRVKREEEFRIPMIFPSWIRSFFHGVSTRLPRPSSLSRLLCFLSMLRSTIPEMCLFKISSGDFVRFSLIPIGMTCCPRWFKAKEFPPEAEVRAKRYVYEPVPMEDVELVDIPLSHLLKPGPHTDRFWVTTFPKKLRTPLVRLPGNNGQRVIGWGIRVNETLSWGTLLLSILVVLTAIGISVILYAKITLDNSSAFSLGAFVVALLTVYLTYQYFAWKESI